MPHRVRKPRKLCETEIEDIHGIVALCNEHDKTTYAFDADDDIKKDSHINHFLLYDDDRLLSAINLFVPMKHEAETTAFTLPQFRRRGLFSRLFSEAKAEVARRGIYSFLLVCDRNSRCGKIVVERLKARYEFSEYSMRLHPERIPDADLNAALQIRGISKSDRSELIRINMASFNGRRDDTERFLSEILRSDKRVFYSVLYGQNIVGMIGVYRGEKQNYIHGFCIEEKYRNRGLGSQVLNYIAREYSTMEPEKDLELEVQVDNAGALSLYRKTGFEVVAAYDYSRLPISPDVH